MFSGSKIYYHVDESTQPNRFGFLGVLFLVSILLLTTVIGYIFLLHQSPELLASVKSDTLVEERSTELIGQRQDFLKIEKLGVVLPITASKDSWLPDSGWHRLPERGNPRDGGNFIIGALRRKVGLTPSQTIESSPFYHLDKLAVDDVIEVNYDGQRYYYQVNNIYSTEPGSVSHESEFSGSRLTMYTAISNGAADGFTVVEAEPTAVMGSGNGLEGTLF